MDPTSGHGDFSSQLQAVLAQADARARLDGLTRLAQACRTFVEAIQLDRAIAQQGNEESLRGLACLRLAVLSTHTIDHLLPAIRVAGFGRGFRLEAYAGAFGQYRQELLDPSSALHRFRPNLVLFSLAAGQAVGGVPLAAAAAEVDAMLARTIDELRELWRHARLRLDAAVIQQSYLDVSQPLFGSYDRLVPAAPSRMILRLNELLAQAVAQEGVLLLDVAHLAAQDGIDAWFDVARWLQGKMEISPQAAPRYAELLMRVIGAMRGKSRKCLVLDLDNTLWGGVLGEVGMTGLALGEGSAQGEAHLALQRYAKSLKERGVVLAVCSKNDQEAAEAVFRDHPEMVLRRGDIAAFVANWQDKVENLKDIARSLNIGLDSVVFVDDNPVERARVRQGLPVVAVPELPDDPAFYVRCLAAGGYFEAVSFTQEDLRRGEQYAMNAQREALRGMTSSLDNFLRGLEMSVVYGPIAEVERERAAQLINKTNQFNLTARRGTVDEFARLCEAPVNLALQFRLIDRFGDNGLVSVMILAPDADADADDARALRVDTWV
ncbi:MAG TPA: HAD-IIIC family phosphatase, partial [Methylibium sp.]